MAGTTAIVVSGGSIGVGVDVVIADVVVAKGVVMGTVVVGTVVVGNVVVTCGDTATGLATKVG
jgi:hypothetical protein